MTDRTVIIALGDTLSDCQFPLRALPPGYLLCPCSRIGCCQVGRKPRCCTSVRIVMAANHHQFVIRPLDLLRAGHKVVAVDYLAITPALSLSV